MAVADAAAGRGAARASTGASPASLLLRAGSIRLSFLLCFPQQPLPSACIQRLAGLPLGMASENYSVRACFFPRYWSARQFRPLQAAGRRRAGISGSQAAAGLQRPALHCATPSSSTPLPASLFLSFALTSCCFLFLSLFPEFPFAKCFFFLRLHACYLSMQTCIWKKISPSYSTSGVQTVVTVCCEYRLSSDLRTLPKMQTFSVI